MGLAKQMYWIIKLAGGMIELHISPMQNNTLELDFIFFQSFEILRKTVGKDEMDKQHEFGGCKYYNNEMSLISLE